MAARAKKHVFLAIFKKRGKNGGFLALAAIFLRLRQNKKKIGTVTWIIWNNFCKRDFALR